MQLNDVAELTLSSNSDWSDLTSKAHSLCEIVKSATFHCFFHDLDGDPITRLRLLSFRVRHRPLNPSGGDALDRKYVSLRKSALNLLKPTVNMSKAPNLFHAFMIQAAHTRGSEPCRAVCVGVSFCLKDVPSAPAAALCSPLPGQMAGAVKFSKY